jgi:uncharacterized alkaline shock family protein YloU
MTSPASPTSSGRATGATSSASSPTPAVVSPSASDATKSALASPDGTITVAESVVSKVAGIAAREMSGVHAMGGTGARAVGSVLQRLPGGSPSVTQGVSVEVGEADATINLDLIVDYGVAIADLARAIQRNVKATVERMTGFRVTEVNVTVADVFVPSDDEGDSSDN